MTREQTGRIDKPDEPVCTRPNSDNAKQPHIPDSEKHPQAGQVLRDPREDARIRTARLRQEHALLLAERDLLRKEIFPDGEHRKRGTNEILYRAIQECHEEQGYPVALCCRILSVSVSAYYKFTSGPKAPRTVENEHLEGLILQIHSEYPLFGYRRIQDELDHTYGIHANGKRVWRLCKKLGVRAQNAPQRRANRTDLTSAS